ncbi:hypothetical protein [Fluviicola sp.]|uniref:hypothetical protein n=1 Tax=Fluviicola sp. TaxID=1917219 RepID=UPI0031D74328
MCALQSSTSLTPHELICKYPETEKWGWNSSKIGTFFSANLLIGKRKLLKARITETSFLELIDYCNKLLIKKSEILLAKTSVNLDFYTPDELVHKYPQVVDDLDWNASKIGVFFNAGLLDGYRDGKEYKALINETSFLELVNYATAISLRK